METVPEQLRFQGMTESPGAGRRERPSALLDIDDEFEEGGMGEMMNEMVLEPFGPKKVGAQKEKAGSAGSIPESAISSSMRTHESQERENVERSSDQLVAGEDGNGADFSNPVFALPELKNLSSLNSLMPQLGSLNSENPVPELTGMDSFGSPFPVIGTPFPEESISTKGGGANEQMENPRQRRAPNSAMVQGYRKSFGSWPENENRLSPFLKPGQKFPESSDGSSESSAQRKPKSAVAPHSEVWVEGSHNTVESPLEPISKTQEVKWAPSPQNQIISAGLTSSGQSSDQLTSATPMELTSAGGPVARLEGKFDEIPEDEDSRKRPSAQLDLGDEDDELDYNEFGDKYQSFQVGSMDTYSFQSRLPDFSTSRRRRKSSKFIDRYENMMMQKDVNLSLMNQLVFQVNAISRGSGVFEEIDNYADLVDTDVNAVLSALTKQLHSVLKRNRLNAIKMQQTWIDGSESKVPDKFVFDNVSVHLRTKFDEFKPQNGLSAVLTSAGGLYNNSSIFSRWEVLSLIGSGSSGKVYKAKSQVLDNEFAAVKFIDKKSSDYSEKKTCREVYCFHVIQRAGGHQNIVEVYEVDEDENYVYIVMELLTGDELLQRISTSGFYMEHNAAEIVTQILESLRFIHSLNIIHRDIKAENFVFCKQGDTARIKLIDFGVAMYSDDYGSVKSTELIGSALYVAPEMWKKHQYTQKVDMFSLGILVHILLTGQTPFPCENVGDYVRCIQEKEVTTTGEMWQSISQAGRDFVARLLTKEPAYRPSSKEALEDLWLYQFESQMEQSTHLAVAHQQLREFSVNQSTMNGGGSIAYLLKSQENALETSAKSSDQQAERSVGSTQSQTQREDSHTSGQLQLGASDGVSDSSAQQAQDFKIVGPNGSSLSDVEDTMGSGKLGFISSPLQGISKLFRGFSAKREDSK